MTQVAQTIKTDIGVAIKAFQTGNLTNNALGFFGTLGYNTERQQPFNKKTYDYFKEYYADESDNKFNEEKAQVKNWKYIDLLFQLSHEELSKQCGIFKKEVITKDDGSKIDIESYLFFVIELKNENYTRTALSQINREINKVFSMPVMVLFKYGKTLTLSVIDRRLNKHDEQKDVLKKVTLIKDISVEQPHRAHIEILFDLSFEELFRIHHFENFEELHDAWKETLDIKELNKRFYQDLSNWYFWAMQNVYFPGAPFQAGFGANPLKDSEVRQHNAKNLIRLLTRILFIWFIKEKNLIPDELFDETFIKNNLLKNFEPCRKKAFNHKSQGSNYYRAVLQNLFFATLNQEAGKRAFRNSGQHMNITNLMRYESYFKNSESFINLVEKMVPFMNGGLFECLDKPATDRKGKRGGDVIIYEDGFSDRPDNELCVPDYIFFGIPETADLSNELGSKCKKMEVRGLINIFKSYKFTITENTPFEEEIALDPELLGKVFENLLASYNPETKTTARKQTGSFYTPREIVNYMVDESLIAYLKQKLKDKNIKNKEDDLRNLIGYPKDSNPFDKKETALLINAIDLCKILDPACGSGAFPMGILHKLVHILHKLDPRNELWQKKQIEKALLQDDDTIREQLIVDIKAAFKNNELDYGRKLYLIENCIYGVDIQPIATQISKLRFFISLIVDQKANTQKKNFGVRPLPNLETKFIAANTLIGIDRPDGMLRNPEIDKLEKDLGNVRHRLFNAKTPSTKRTLRDKDTSIRKKMSTLLLGSGWENESARQIVVWDPYDQSMSSPFFDPEWMFGLTNGFDVVIGNPPYKILTKNNTPINEHGYYIEHYKAIENSYSKNLFTLFIEYSLKLLRPTANLSYIVPEGLFKTRSYTGCVDLMKKTGNTKSVVTFTNYVFENAVTGNLIFLFEKDRKGETLHFQFNSEYELSKIELIENTLTSKIEKNSLPLKEIATTFKGMVVKDRNTVLFTEKNKNKNIFLLGKNISKWKIKSKYYTNYDTLQIVGGTKKLTKHNRAPRILIRRTGSTLCCSYLEKSALTESTLYSCWPNSHKFSDKFLIALLNSRMLDYYNKTLFITNQQGFPQILMTDLEQLPIKQISEKDQKPFINLVDKILTITKSDDYLENPSKQTFVKKHETQIDQLVYKLYNLTPEEIKIVENTD